MEYKIRLAQKEDLPRILEIYAYAREFMAQTGNANQWGKTNPPAWRTEADIQEERLWAITDETGIHGVFFFNLGEDPTYGEIYRGSWRSDKPYGVIHRVAGDGSGGIFRACLDFCGRFSGHLRIDTHRDNKVMQHVIEKAGFQKRGIIHLADGSERIAYDRV